MFRLIDLIPLPLESFIKATTHCFTLLVSSCKIDSDLVNVNTCPPGLLSFQHGYLSCPDLRRKEKKKEKEKKHPVSDYNTLHRESFLRSADCKFVEKKLIVPQSILFFFFFVYTTSLFNRPFLMFLEASVQGEPKVTLMSTESKENLYFISVISCCQRQSHYFLRFF